MSEVYTQHVLHSVTYFFEYCHREATLGEQAMIILGSADEYVDGADVRSYMAAFHPKTAVHLMEGWVHGSFCHPMNNDAVVEMLRGFLADESASEQLRRTGSRINVTSSTIKGSASELVLDALARTAVGL